MIRGSGHWHRVTTFGLVIRYVLLRPRGRNRVHSILAFWPRCWMDTPRFVYRGTRFKPQNTLGLRQVARQRIESCFKTISENNRRIVCTISNSSGELLSAKQDVSLNFLFYVIFCLWFFVLYNLWEITENLVFKIRMGNCVWKKIAKRDREVLNRKEIYLLRSIG